MPKHRYRRDNEVMTAERRPADRQHVQVRLRNHPNIYLTCEYEAETDQFFKLGAGGVVAHWSDLLGGGPIVFPADAVSGWVPARSERAPR
jgi:hypothetical protein